MELVFIIIIFLVLTLLVIWLPFVKQQQANKNADDVDNSQRNIREETNISLYHEHKSEIEKDYAEGGIDEESYQYLLSELDNSLLQDIETSATEKATHKQVKKSFGFVWPAIISVFIIGFSLSLYNDQGTYKQITTVNAQISSEQQEINREEEALAYLKELQQLVKDNPKNTAAWYDLGQTLVGMGEFDSAVIAFDRVISIEGEHADLIGAKAQAIYYKNNQTIDEELQRLIDKALALNINDPSTNILLGMHNFLAQNYQKAIEHWQRILDSTEKNVNKSALREAVAEAKNRLGLPLEPENKKELSGPQLIINVSLSDEIAQKLAETREDKIVFVYAIPTNGQRMPLAAVKLTANQLPITVTLNDSSAMSPQANLSSVEKVNLFAIVSNKGGVGIKEGDFKAELSHIPVNHKETLTLVINTVVEAQ